MKRKISIPTIAVFALSAVLLLSASVNGARAALSLSETYQAEFNMQEIGVSLLENGTVVATDTNSASGTLLSGITDFAPGVVYDEAIAVQNTGVIDQFVRVTIRKYWVKDANKQVDLDPSMITLELAENSGWVEDTAAATPEQSVFYYTNSIAAGEVTNAITTTLKVDGDLVRAVNTETVVDANGRKTITHTYEYDGVSFGLEAEVDAVQTHHADDAILSAWGRNVSVNAAENVITLQ